jgi:hypothetical protein
VKNTSKALAFFLIVFASAVPTLDSNASGYKPLTQDNWNYPGPASIGEREVLFYDQDSVSVPTYLIDTSTASNIYEFDPTCSSTKDSRCSLEDFKFNAVLPFCKSDEDLNCLVGMGAVDSRGNKIIGKYVENFPAKAENEFQGNSKWKLPSGGSGALFTIPGANNSGGNTYFVSSTVRGQGGKNLTPIVSAKSFEVSITPVSIKNENYDCSNIENCRGGGFTKFTNPKGKEVWGIFGAKWNNSDKTMVEYSGIQNKSLHRVAFPSDLKFYVDIRLNFSPSGWLHGRLLDPLLSITKSNEIYALHFEGNPVRVPVVFAKTKWNSLAPGIKSFYDESGTWKCKVANCMTEFSRVGVFLDYASDNLEEVQITETPYPSGVDAIDQLNAWLPVVKNTAAAVLSNWSVRTLSARESTGSNKCFSDSSRIMGIVTTNSTQYSAGPPEFDKKKGVLNYKVSSPHFELNETPFKGTYNLLMRNEVARCLYGFKKAVVQAEISIINEKGQTSIATTSISQNKTWISLKASNFEFSSPTIKIRLKQKKVR